MTKNKINTLFGVEIRSSALVLPGMQILFNDGQPVCCVPIGSPIEDAICDAVVIHPDDYRRIVEHIRPVNNPKK